MAKATKVAWDQARPAPVVLVSGAEQLLVSRAVGSIRSQLRQAHADLEVTEFSANSYAPGTLLTLASPSLFGEPRLILVSDVESCNDDFLSEALDYVHSPADDVYLVLKHGGGVRGKKLLDRVRSSQVAIEIACAELKKDADRQQFVWNEFRSVGKQVSPTAVRALLGAFSGDLAQLAAACQQLIADVEGSVTDEHIELYFSGRVEVTAFKVADAAIAGQTEQALLLLRHALATGADPVPIVAAFAAKIRLMAKVSGQHAGAAQLAGKLGAAPWQIERAQRDVRSWSEQDLARAITALATADAQVKGASRDPLYALERMMLNIT